MRESAAFLKKWHRILWKANGADFMCDGAKYFFWNIWHLFLFEILLWQILLLFLFVMEDRFAFITLYQLFYQ